MRKFTEKLQWLCLYDRKMEYTELVDKIEVKNYVAKRIGEKYIIPTYTYWDNFEDVDVSILPDKFVLKCNHNQGCIAFCKDKDKFDLNSYETRFRKALKINAWYVYREWAYKNVKRRIFAEEFLEINDAEIPGLIDYKFFCFNGVPKFLYVCREQYLKNDKDYAAEMNFLDMEYNVLPVNRVDKRPFDELPEKPKKFEEMKEIARKLSEPFKFIRVDLYEVNGEIYFGELTFKPTGGFMRLVPEEYDEIWGEYLDLSK